MAIAQILVVAGAHVAFLYFSYGSRFFGLHLPAPLLLAPWLGGSSCFAFAGYYLALRKLQLLRAFVWRGAAAAAATMLSLYIGVFLAFNGYGT